jgi:hypothetical protein
MLTERPNCLEFFRDRAADKFERHANWAWLRRPGSMFCHRIMTSAMIDSCDFLAAKRRAATKVSVPACSKIVFTGDLDFNDHRLIRDRLDRDQPLWSTQLSNAKSHCLGPRVLG